MTSHPARRTRLRRHLLAWGIALLALPLLQSASNADGVPPQLGLPYLGYDPHRPGSKYPENVEAAWSGVVQVGMAGSTRAKQWARIPLGIMAVNASVDYEVPMEEGGRYSSPASVRGFFVSPTGSENAYGESPLIPVRTVAFGSIPVQATLQLVQRRDTDDLPIGLEINANWGTAVSGGSFWDPATLVDRVGLRVRSLVIDGVDLHLRPNCSTTTWSTISLTSKYLEGPYGEYEPDAFDPAQAYSAFYGGTLSGTIDIPAFAGCKTASGDDVSRVLTAAIAGPNNPVVTRVSGVSCFTISEDGRILPPAPGATTPKKAECIRPGVGQHPIPSNPKIVVVPDPIPFPNHAP